MDKRILTLAALAVVMLSVAVPLMASDDAYADDTEAADTETANQIAITLPDGLDYVTVTVGNGATESFTIYVYNSSDDYLMMTVSTSSDSDDLDLEAVTSTFTLSPEGTSEWGHTATVEINATVDQYDTGTEETGTVYLTFQDMSGQDESFTIPVQVVVSVDSDYYVEGGTNKFLGLFDNTLSGALGSEWFTAIVTFIVWIIISIVVCWLVIPLFTRVFAKNSSDEERKKLRKSLTSLVTLLIAVVAIGQCLTILGASAEVQSAFDTLSGVLYTIIGAVLVWVVYVFIINAVIRGAEKGSGSAIDSSLIPLFRMIGKLVIAVCAAAAILAAFGVDLTGILVSAGVITLGITLGAQDVLEQFFSGIVLLATRPFTAGDYVEINGNVYVVRQVKLMYTEFDNDDFDRVVTIPNDVVAGGTIVNMTGEGTQSAVYVYFTVSSSADLDKARELMVQAAEENPEVVTDGSRSAPSTRMTALGDNSVELRLCVFIKDYKKNGGVAGDIRARVNELFAENGIPSPVSSMEVTVKGSQ